MGQMRRLNAWAAIGAVAWGTTGCEPPPATIDDPAILDEIGDVLKR